MCETELAQAYANEKAAKARAVGALARLAALTEELNYAN